MRMQLIIITLITAVSLTGCSIYQMMGDGAESYFRPLEQAPELVEIAAGIYAYESGIDRSLVLETSDGLVVIESFNTEHATGLKRMLDEEFPGREVTHLLYSHNHRDHTLGGAALSPKEVWAHENTEWHFDRYGTDELEAPTQYFPPGDQTIVLGDVEIQLLDFANAHAEHMWGFYFAEARVLYAPDLAFCETFPPFGFPDFNQVGLVEALDRAAALDIDHYVPSHFPRGDKSCITEYRGLFVDGRAAVERAFETHGVPHEFRGSWFAAVLNDVEAELEPKYGDWHGFDSMLVPFMTRQLSGAYLGF